MPKLSIAEIRKGEIIEAFLRVVSEKGLAKATVREVAEAAECSHGMVRHFFGDKESMIIEVVNYVIQKNLTDFRKRVAEHKSALDRLKFGISWWLERERFDIDWGWTVMELRVYSKASASVSEALENYYDLARATIAGMIRGGIESGEFRHLDADSAAELILAELDGLLRLWYVNPKKMSLKAMAKRATELFEGYLTRGK